MSVENSITDIVNRDIANLTNCESEPIHIPGSIQPHGFLLGVNIDSKIIDFCSANTSDYIPFSPEILLGRHLTKVCSKKQFSDLLSYIEKIDSAKPFVFRINKIRYNTSVHKSGNTLILELEPFPDGTVDLPNLYTQTRNFVLSLETDNYLPGLSEDIATQTRKITGYDRVLIYRFDEEYNGEVIAESKRDDLESYNGQKYPHTDIPVQARELYMRNPLRMIADVDYKPIPILTLNDSRQKDHSALDLSLSVLRSVSPIHIEYLKNMGIGATLTISLMQRGRLWGLIACHHYSPLILAHYTRLSALLQGHFLSSQIAVREVAEEFEINQAVDRALSKALLLLHENEGFIEEFFAAPCLLEVANATGFAIYYHGILYKNGKMPGDADLIHLLKSLSERYPAISMHSDKLIDVFPRAKNLGPHAAGFIYHCLSAGSEDGIIWLRVERKETINWAGDPNKSVIVNEEGISRLSPRKSFELWIEEVKNKSEGWRKSEIGGTTNFAFALQKHVTHRYVLAQEKENRLLNQELKASNEELANFNWISAHDLIEPLRKIQVFASKVLAIGSPELSVQIKDYVNRMGNSAEKMQLLIADILAYSKTANMDKIFEATDLNILLNQVTQELDENIRENDARISSDSLPILDVIPFQVRQLFLNLISNALKFSETGVNPEISITYKFAPSLSFENYALKTDLDYHAISFRDNGIGFDQRYANKIFDVFQRLHTNSKYKGTGIGLAICKKAMQNHKGHITGKSQPGKGALFTLYFPHNPAVAHRALPSPEHSLNKI
jgi:two-component system, chemotaxis family, sensor kinase Cph1